MGSGVRTLPGPVAASSLMLFLLVTGCSGDSPAVPTGCGRSTAAASADAIGLTADQDFTSSLAIVEVSGGTGTEIEWMPVYSINNLTDNRICVYDVVIDFPAKDLTAKYRVQLVSLGPARQITLYRDRAAIEADAGAIKRGGTAAAAPQPPPVEVAPHGSVLARFYQYFRFTLNDETLPMTLDDTLAEYLGPYFGLRTVSEGGRYACDQRFTGLHATVESDLGRSAHTVSEVLMPAGCVSLIPPR